MADRQRRRTTYLLDEDDPIQRLDEDPREAARRRLEARRRSAGSAAMPAGDDASRGSSREDGRRGGASGRSRGAGRAGGSHPARGGQRASGADSHAGGRPDRASRRASSNPYDSPDLGYVGRRPGLLSSFGSQRSGSMRSAGLGGRPREAGAYGGSGGSALASINLPFVGMVALAILLVVALAFGIRGCVGHLGGSSSHVSQVTTGDFSFSGNFSRGTAAVLPNFNNLPDDLPDELLDALLENCLNANVARAINASPALASLGSDQQAKLLKLAATEPASGSFVADLPRNYPQQTGQPYTEPVAQGTIPRLYQWDPRWGYTSYCAQAFGSSGCCPTSLAMVYMGLTGNTDKTPYDMGQIADELGYAVDNQGTVGGFLSYEADNLGLACTPFEPSSVSLEWYLENDFVVIINVGKGDFTDSGHFFVATGLDDDGNLVINDPYSEVRSNQVWDIDRVTAQAGMMYAFQLA